MLGRHPARWIGRFSDPAGINDVYPPSPVATRQATAFAMNVVTQAGGHNTLMAVTHNVRASATDAPGTLFEGPRRAEAIETLCTALANERLAILGRSMRLARAAREIATQLAAAGLPAMVVKGPDFAEKAYGGLHLRAFGDIDLLSDPDAAPEVADIVTRHGFVPVPAKGKRVDHAERKFVRAGPDRDPDMVEIHTDMVHAPELRVAMSLTYRMLTDTQCTGSPTMAGRLVLAALHGATSHMFNRMQYVVDMLAIARAGVDADDLVERCAVSHAAGPVRTGLWLAHRMFACDACATLLDAVPAPRHGQWTGGLITPRTVLRARTPLRVLSIPGRHAYRRQLAASR